MDWASDGPGRLGATAATICAPMRLLTSALARSRLLTADTLCLSALLLIAAAVATNFGFYDHIGLVLLVASIPLAAGAQTLSREEPPLPLWAAFVGICALMAIYRGYLYHQMTLDGGSFIDSLQRPIIFALAASTAASVLLSTRHHKVAWVLVAASIGLVGCAIAPLWKWGLTGTDVIGSIHAADDLLLRGQNPYLATFPLFVRVGVPPVQAHLVYGPSIAVISAVGRLFGDARLVSVVLFAVLFVAILAMVRRTERSRRIRIAAASAAFPFTIGMVLIGWVDIYVMAPLALWAVLRDRYRVPAIMALSICFASKPTYVFAIAPFVIWSARARREVGLGLIGAAAIAVPFVYLTGVRGFFDDVVGFHVVVLRGNDSLTFAAWMFQFGLPEIPAALSVIIVLLCAPPIVLRRPRDYGDAFAAGAALSTLGFLLAKEAYFNYYFVPATLLLMSLAARGKPIDDPQSVHLPRWPGTLRRRFTTGNSGLLKAVKGPNSRSVT